MATPGGTLALDWFSATSRRLDKLDAEQQRRFGEARDFRRQLAAAQRDDSTASSETGSPTGSQSSSFVALPTSLIEAKSIPSRSELLGILHDLKRQRREVSAQRAGHSSPINDSAQLARVTYATYALALQGLFDEADRLQDSTWYWRTVEDGSWTAGLYLLQTLPARLLLLAKEAYKITLERTSALKPSQQQSRRIDKDVLVQTFRQLRNTPNVVVGTLWPHSINPPDGEDIDNFQGSFAATSTSTGKASLASPLVLLSKAKRLSPINLTIHEAQSKRALLTKRRDKVAEQLGALTVVALNHQNETQEPSAETLEDDCRKLTTKMHEILLSSSTTSKDSSLLQEDALLDLLSSASPALTTPPTVHAPIGLSPPSRLSTIWPRLVLYPTVLLFSLRLASNNRDLIRQTMRDGKETIKGFIRNWLITPIKDLLDTIRGPDIKEESGGIVTKQGRQADLESLERMVTQYAVEKGQISSDDVARAAELRRKVREGDLDVVMRAYEDQLKSPLKSLTVGSLPRLLLIQVQKAKYDLAVAMSGIDHLLQSQALLFGAVGIAPAMGIVWLAFKSGKWLFVGSNGRRQASTRQEKARAWESMRRVDRLLTSVSVSTAASATPGASKKLSAKAYGLLLLELSSLRRIASSLLLSSSYRGGKRRSRARKSSSSHSDSDGRLANFIQDVRDLEVIAGSGRHGDSNGDARFSARKAAVERMWRCWSGMFVVEL